MRNRFTGAFLAALLVIVATNAAAQTPARPRIPEAKPNLHGICQVLNTAAGDFQEPTARFVSPAGQAIVDGNEIPNQPAALAKKRANFKNRATADPETKGYLPGVPRIMFMPFPFQ